MSVDWTKPIQTVEGLPARLLGTLNKPDDDICKSRVVAIKNSDGYESVFSYPENGYFLCKEGEYRLDIINVPPRKVTREVDAWAIIDGEDHEIMLATFNKAIADRNAGTSTVVRLTGTYEVEVEE